MTARAFDDDPVLAALARAPRDDVPESDEERAACAHAMKERGFLTNADMQERLEAWRIEAGEEPLGDG